MEEPLVNADPLLSFLGPDSPPELIAELLRLAEGFATRFFLGRERTLLFREDEDIRANFLGAAPEHGVSLEDVLGTFERQVASGAIAQFHPRYVAFPDCGNAAAAALAGMLIPILNQNPIATAKSAPTGTFIEIQVIRWLRELVGYSDANLPTQSALDVGGIACSGGVMANTVALLLARSVAFPEVRRKGLSELGTRPLVFIPGRTLNHYSHSAAASWIGVGEENVVMVPPRSDYSMDPTELDRLITAHKREGTGHPFAVIAQAGDSRTNAFDNFRELAEVTNRHGVWLHVDACHGGSLLFSRKYRERLAGIELADSLAVDPHKGLFCPYPSSYLLLRRREHLALLSRSTDITLRKGSYDLGQISPFLGSRSLDSLKLWFLIQNLGLRRLSEIVDKRQELVEYWHRAITNSHFFIPLNEVVLTNIAFSIKPELVYERGSEDAADRLSALNRRLHDQVYREALYTIHTFKLLNVRGILNSDCNREFQVLGTSIGNPLTAAKDLDHLLNYLEGLVKRFLEEQ